jgi:hypothetical protein
MKKIYFSKLFSLENNSYDFQIFNLINSIIIAINNKKNIVIVDKFLNDRKNTQITSNISDIINLEKFNIFLKNNYNISVFDRENLDFQVHSIKYGHPNNNIDLRNEILSQFSIPNNLRVETNVNLNFLKNYDPIPNVQKSIYIHYSINNIHLKEIYDEQGCYLKEPIIFNLDDSNFIHNSYTLSNVKNNKNIFDHILENLCFTNIYDIITKNYLETNNLIDTKINILDLQIIGNKNNNNNSNNKIENKYISLIDKYINKNENIIILPSNYHLDDNKYLNNEIIIDFLKKNGYKYYIHSYLPVLGNEINTIIDLNLGIKCNSTYIGCFNMYKLSGSNFTYSLIQLMSKESKHVLIDIDNIDGQELINF